MTLTVDKGIRVSSFLSLTCTILIELLVIGAQPASVGTGSLLIFIRVIYPQNGKFVPQRIKIQEKTNRFQLLCNALLVHQRRQFITQTEESDLDEPPASPTLFLFEDQDRELYRKVMKYPSAPRVLDFFNLHPKPSENYRG